ncbi:hypothetical protein, unknown function [Leishmania infantum JPCM5]|uniref:Uncharacterized protein n=2 Tax=Leishmania infantum TaxID=5671 RepID=E9AHM0_LEIIN|nr:hypothetical protein, unknown function [Leishmania infantum JPCM5]CAC9523755.1 hypothetical_protein_-_conserved [Leishmania infantum]CBZ08914.1 hypothetical protein, unknown function [Leishmania infantum JPCM5]SUZ44649.1 hypothetical_protein_-_conserved [Leishmania infantum]|eukprot:XP_003392721.1 hypothetical protein, unknown function [Leishmania infantum JPCM5]
MLSTHTCHQLAALSFLLRDPRQFPVVIVTGRSMSAFTTLYRLLPTAAYMMYNTEARFDGCTAFIRADYPDVPRPSSVRLVPHTSALLGPELCEKSGAYVDVMQAAAETVGAAEVAPSLNVDDGVAAEFCGGGSITPGELDEELRQSITSSFNEQFIASIEDECGPPSAHRSCRETAPVQPAGKLEARRRGREFLHHSKLHRVGSGSVVSHHNMHHEAVQHGIHWVVPRWLIDCKVDLRKAMYAWRSLLSQSRPGEVVSLVLFVNVDVVDLTSLIGHSGLRDARGWPRLKSNAVQYEKLCRASPPPEGCAACAALKLPLRAPSQLRAALLSLEANATAVAESSSGCAPSAEVVGARTPAQSIGAQSGASAGLPPRRGSLEVPIVNCWAKASAMEIEHAKHAHRLTVDAFRHLFSVFDVHHPMHRRRLRGQRSMHESLQRIPDPLQKWQWVLQKDSTPYPVPLSDATLSRVLPYVLVKDAKEQRRQHQRALRRNVVDAATLQSLNSRGLSAAVFTAGSARAGAPFPNPRYFTTLVSDAGSLLVRDGCLSDLFVMEFQPTLLEAELSSHYWRSVREKALGGITGLSLRQYRALLELLSAAEKLVAAEMPPASLTRDVLKNAVRFLYTCGRGRGLLAWPLADPAEGYHRLRVAFTLSYEFYADPLVFSWRFRGAPRAGCVGEAQIRHLASGAGVASYHAAAAAGSGSAESQCIIETLKDAISYILATMRRLGWVLVWQEDHHRWPTAVPPPHMHHPHINATRSVFPLSRCTGPALQERIAASLERWRHEQLRFNNKRYDADVSAGALKTPSSHQTVESTRAAAADAATASPYTSLDVWQAALIPEDAGVYLWEGQTVFLDEGCPGVIVEFRPPPAELFTPIEQHPTEAKRAYWRAQQELHADFIRFYRWRRDCFAAANPRQVRAAFTSLPHYVRAREMTHFPVVELLHASPDGKRPLVQVLPIRAMQYHVAYPRVCAVSGAEQKSWHEAQGRPAPSKDELRDVVWRLSTTDVDNRSASQVTLLRLPLSPFRIEAAALPFVSRVMELSRRPVGHRTQRALWHATTTKKRQALFQRLNVEWASCHGKTVVHDRLSTPQLRAVKERAHINWRLVPASRHSSAALYFAFFTAHRDTVLP